MDTAYALLVSFNWVPFSFLVYANITFKCLKTRLRRKLFWLLSRINSLQNQNTYEHNFNLIMSYSCLFNSDMRIGTCLDQTQKVWFVHATYHTSKCFCTYVGVCTSLYKLDWNLNSLEMLWLENVYSYRALSKHFCWPSFFMKNWVLWL